jgi:type II secretory pathway component PulF
MNFWYTGLFNGRQESGSVEAASRDEAIARLRANRITSLTIVGQSVPDS